ncbi:hypothetical protein TPHA_0J00230 [Tetrapisispora phaffii CBS 4417]|uniref:ATP synthase subunit epsilon, mitochondrial n=1 Tax=Tetrapisispora phaffii (strain ATCC 24235 / CBS 4417 / NBRC 1672 / NRRL Y-8282 / UCD 70-5) TaxID=1071381 RepID=G8BYA5_TETPH|nr:hypothetical protein TPHA_0J00230 [Tetrapisispora phaffii CBS 4417]CCE64847.1 hypothetical protein TPHA_0J00230 [Tetrapisispora phaffii CBS 4417]
MSTWRKAGLTYSNYLAVAAKTVRQSLKNDLKTNSVLSRSKTDIKYTIFEKGTAKSEPTSISD